MQIIKAEVIPVELKLNISAQTANAPPAGAVMAVFLHLTTRQGQSAWGCTVADPASPPETTARLLGAMRDCAAKLPDLHPFDLEYTLSELTPLARDTPAALCAFDLALYDLLSLAAGMPLYRLLGGYRNRILTSVTLPLAPVQESVESACERAAQGFRILKIKGGLDPELDVQRVKAIRRALPDHTLRLDADGGYTARQALDVARALQDCLEMLEQPTPAADLQALRQVSQLSPLPVLADQSVRGPASALEIAAGRCAHGLSVKLAGCGGLRCARQVDAIARAARLSTMAGCLIEPALLVAGGLSFALSSPNVQYGDLDGHLPLLDDPSRPGFTLQDGWLIAAETPGLGSSVELG